jgi:hypothetical protein
MILGKNAMSPLLLPLMSATPSLPDKLIQHTAAQTKHRATSEAAERRHNGASAVGDSIRRHIGT